MTTLWIKERLGSLVPHRFKAWFICHDDALYKPIRGFKGPLTATPVIRIWDPMDIDTSDWEVEEPESNLDFAPETPAGYHG